MSSLNATPTGERIHIGIFGKRNAGKSSLINAITTQKIAIVSDFKGTTTDPVFKAMELLPLGPVMIIDTPGIDDEGELGKLRVEKAYQILNKTNIAILVIDSTIGISPEDVELLNLIKEKKVPVIIAFNKCELLTDSEIENLKADVPNMFVSAATGENIYKFNSALAKLIPEEEPNIMLEDIVAPGDVVVLVTPIDSAAPAGRLILPQVQLIRDVLDKDCVCIAVKETDLEMTLKEKGIKPDLVITDSKVFEMVDKIVPKDIKLTSFSVVLARMKGAFEQYLKGTPYLDKLKDGDKVLMLESCTHQPTCEDIGRVKLPAWITKYTGKKLEFSAVSGLSEIETPLTDYAMIIQCGGCVATASQIRNRLLPALENNVPVSNYGLVIAYIHGIFNRATEIFK